MTFLHTHYEGKVITELERVVVRAEVETATRTGHVSPGPVSTVNPELASPPIPPVANTTVGSTAPLKVCAHICRPRCTGEPEPGTPYCAQHRNLTDRVSGYPSE
jgi:hypothetical protein